MRAASASCSDSGRALALWNASSRSRVMDHILCSRGSPTLQDRPQESCVRVPPPRGLGRFCAQEGR
jgi:hypothetical protein